MDQDSKVMASGFRVGEAYTTAEFSNEAEDAPPRGLRHGTENLKQPFSSPIQYYGSRFCLSPNGPVIFLVRYDWYGRIIMPIHIHSRPRTTLACIAALALYGTIHETGLPWRIDHDSIQPGSDPSRWIKTTTHKVVHSCQNTEHRTHVKLGLIGPPVFGPVFKSLMLDDDDPPAANYPQSRFLDELKGVCGVPTITGYRSVTVDSRITHPLRLSGPRCLTVDCAVQTAEHLVGISFFASRKEFFNAIKSCIESGYRGIVGEEMTLNVQNISTP